jgi:hypothetical protein
MGRGLAHFLAGHDAAANEDFLSSMRIRPATALGATTLRFDDWRRYQRALGVLDQRISNPLCAPAIEPLLVDELRRDREALAWSARRRLSARCCLMGLVPPSAYSGSVPTGSSPGWRGPLEVRARRGH